MLQPSYELSPSTSLVPCLHCLFPESSLSQPNSRTWASLPSHHVGCLTHSPCQTCPSLATQGDCPTGQFFLLPVQSLGLDPKPYMEQGVSQMLSQNSVRNCFIWWFLRKCVKGPDLCHCVSSPPGASEEAHSVCLRPESLM